MIQGKKIKDARLKAGLSQVALAKQVHIQRSRLSKIETDTVSWIRSDTLKRLCDVLRLTPNDLMGYTHGQ